MLLPCAAELTGATDARKHPEIDLAAATGVSR
jgi:hypothetical protein